MCMIPSGFSSKEELEFYVEKLRNTVTDTIMGGKAKYTGNNRVYHNGAVGHEVRCKQCKLKFWILDIPWALCSDCRKF